MNEKIAYHILTHLNRAPRHEALRGALFVLGISQLEAATEAGVDHQRLRKILTGQYKDRGELDRIEQVILNRMEARP